MSSIVHSLKPLFRQKSGFIIWALLLILSIVFYLKYSNKPAFLVLEQLGRVDPIQKKVVEVILIKAAPKDPETLRQFIEVYNKDREFPYPVIEQTFIREPAYIFLPVFTLSKNINYEDPNLSMNEVNNLDIIALRSRLYLPNGQVMDTLNVLPSKNY